MWTLCQSNFILYIDDYGNGEDEKRFCEMKKIGFVALTLMLLSAPSATAWNDDSRDSRNGNDNRYDRNDRQFDNRYNGSGNEGIIPPYIRDRNDANRNNPY